MITSKSYIEKRKALMHNNKAMKGNKKNHIQKGVGNKIQHPQEIKQNIQGRMIKDGILVKEGEFLKLCTSPRY